MQIDWRPYCVTDPDLSDGHGRMTHTMEQAVLDEATVVQLHNKNTDDGTLREDIPACRETIELAAAKRAAGAELLANDRLEIMVELGTYLHIERSDGDSAVIREALGPGRLLGVSTSSRAELDAVAATGRADVVGLSPVWSTNAKTNTASTPGLGRVRELLTARPTGLSVMAIGGISATNTAKVVTTGVDGVCAVSTIAVITRPREIAARLKEFWGKS